MRNRLSGRFPSVLLIAAAFVAGCRGEESTPVPPSPAAANAPPAPNVIPKGPIQPQPVVRPNAKPTPSPVASRSLPPGVDPDDVFFAMPADRGNFTIVENADGTHPRDWFVAVLPATGSDSSSFRVRFPEGVASRAAAARLPEGFVAVVSAGTTADGWPNRIRCEEDDAEMVFIPGGVFLFGCKGPAEQSLPAHPVELDPFYIDVQEVTLGRYQAFIDASRDKRRVISGPANAGASPEHPVLGVEWGEAVRYATWAGKALPTEAEWELAARGPDSFDCPWGNGRAVWDGHREAGAGQIDAAGTFSTDQSVFGVLDVAGNAKEWVWDFFSDQHSDPVHAQGGAAVKNPAGPRRPSIANHRVVKGGGPHWELWHRTSAGMNAPTPDLGFRCVLRVARDGNKISVRTLDGNNGSEPDDGAPAGRNRARNPRNPAPGL
ncbi:MAG: formylglycine-generating enzyme family protein [Planctomycetaceae bacterium]